MYKILHNDPKQKEFVRYLCSEIFGDPQPYVDFFIEKRYNLSNCFVLTKEDAPIGMLHSFPCSLMVGKKSYSCRYLYYIGVLKQYRNLGLATKMINYAVDVQHSEGTDVFCLLPANDALYKFYQKIGFQEFFKCDLIDISVEKKNLPSVNFSAEPDLNLFCKIRESFLASCKSYVKWDRHAIEYAVEECIFTGGRAIVFERTHDKSRLEYALIKSYDEKTKSVFVSEFAGSDFSALTSCIVQIFPVVQNIKVRYPAKNGAGSKFGMIKSVTPVEFNYESANNFLPYLGLTMD